MEKIKVFILSKGFLENKIQYLINIQLLKSREDGAGGGK